MKNIENNLVQSIITLVIMDIVFLVAIIILRGRYECPWSDIVALGGVFSIAGYFVFRNVLRIYRELPTNSAPKNKNNLSGEFTDETAANIADDVKSKNNERRSVLDLTQAVGKYLVYNSIEHSGDDLISILEILQKELGNKTVPKGRVPHFIMNLEKSFKDPGSAGTTIQQKVLKALKLTNFDL